MSGGLSGYLNRRALAPAFVLLYALIAVTATRFRGGNELYPFFNWSLFSSASNPKYDTILVVHSINGQKLSLPTSFYELPDRFGAARSRDSRLAKALDRLAVADVWGDKDTEQRVRGTIESTFLREAAQADYDVAIIRYDPIARLKTGTIEHERIVKSYRKDFRQ